MITAGFKARSCRPLPSQVFRRAWGFRCKGGLHQKANCCSRRSFRWSMLVCDERRPIGSNYPQQPQYLQAFLRPDAPLPSQVG
jgi:hypothetical protein